MAALALILLVTPVRREALVALTFATAMFASTFAYYGADTGKAHAKTSEYPTYSMIQFNARYDNADPELLIDLLYEQNPDFVTLQEVTPRLSSRLSEIGNAYPYQHICNANRIVGGTAILSRHPWADGTSPACKEKGLLALATIDMDGLPLQVAAVHLYWPWPHQQPAQIKRIAPLLKTPGPFAIVAGDFNAAPWSAAVQQIASASGTRIMSPGPTWLPPAAPVSLRPIAGLPIDHILINGIDAINAPVRLRDAGSDHLPLLLRFRAIPPPKG